MRRVALRAGLVVGLLGSLVMTGVAAAQSVPEAVQESVVKIFATYRGPSFESPWNKDDPMEFTGTGFVIEGNRILTNAHVVEYATQIFVQPRNSADKLRAELVSISHGIDLAIIELRRESDAEEFFAGRPALTLKDELPRIGVTVQSVGYPEGGDQQSITEGVVSRIEYTGYNQDTSGLRIQTDAAINHGNSGGPVVLDGEVIGVAFAGLEYADNIGYIIPVEEVQTFLADVADGSYDGKPTLRVSGLWTCENQALRDRLGLGKDQTGLLYRAPSNPLEDSPFEDWDVIDRIGGHDIDNVGMVTLSGDLRVDWRYLVPKVAVDGAVEMGVIRGGAETAVTAKVASNRPVLLPWLENDYPEYFIAGPMVFLKVTKDLMQNYMGYFAYLALQGNPVAARAEKLQAFEGEELVALSSEFLPHPITKGYAVAGFPTLKAVNGETVKSLAHLVELVRDADGDFIEFEFYDKSQETLIFDRQELMDVTEEILEDNSIRKQGSDRLMDVWED